MEAILKQGSLFSFLDNKVDILYIYDNISAVI